MNSDPPTSWINNVRRAAWTLLFVVVVVFVAWQLLKRLLVPLVVLLALVGIFKLALGMYRRDRW